MTRVLVAIDPRMYREVIAHFFRGHRPRVEVWTSDPEELGGEARRLSPQLVVCHRVSSAVRSSAVSWVELEVRPGAASLDASVKVDSRPTSKVEQAEMADVLAALDETEEMIRQA